jgi:hypothetical protein
MHILRQLFLYQPAVSPQDSHRHGQVKARSFFLDVRRRQIDGDLRDRNFIAAVSQGGTDALPALSHGGVWQADGLEVLFLAPGRANIDLYLNDVGVNP